MTIEEIKNQLEDLIKDRESFMVGDYDKDIYDRDKEVLEFEVKAVEKGYKDGKADAQKSGQWMICSDGYYPYCSICKNEPKSRIMTDYCPNCGAFMKG